MMTKEIDNPTISPLREISTVESLSEKVAMKKDRQCWAKDIFRNGIL